MNQKWRKLVAGIALGVVAGLGHAQEVIRLGNLKLAHFGAVSYMKEIAPSCGIKVEERMFAKGFCRISGPSLESCKL